MRSALYVEYACKIKPLSEALSTLHALGSVTARRGERTQVRDRDLPTALAEVKTQLDQVRGDADDTIAARLTDLHDRLTDAARDQQERLHEPLTSDMRDRHTSTH